MKKICNILLIFIIPAFCKSQWYEGQGIFPIDTTFYFDNIDSNTIKIYPGSAWQINKNGKAGLVNTDTSSVIVTDTNSVNVKTGVHYFDISMVNYLITGDTSHNIYSNGYGFWNYDIIIKHKHNITAGSVGNVLFRNIANNPFDTLYTTFLYSYCSDPLFGAIHNYSGIFPWGPDQISYPDNSFTGIRDTQWVYTDYYWFFLPVKTSQQCNPSTDYNYDTTTIRFSYNAPDSITGGPGWMIQSVKIVTYLCTANCPSTIPERFIESGEILLFPNPAKDILLISNLKSDNSSSIKIQIFSDMEFLYKEMFFQGKRETINLPVEDLPSGVYALRLIDNGRKKPL